MIFGIWSKNATFSYENCLEFETKIQVLLFGIVSIVSWYTFQSVPNILSVGMTKLYADYFENDDF